MRYGMWTIRTILAVPMLKGHDLVGTITIYRLEVKPFKQANRTVQTFADQAVSPSKRALFDEVQGGPTIYRIAAAADGHRRRSQVISRSAFTFTRYSKRWSKVRSGYAGPTGHSSSVSMVSCCGWQRPLTVLQSSRRG